MEISLQPSREYLEFSLLNREARTEEVELKIPIADDGVESSPSGYDKVCLNV